MAPLRGDAPAGAGRGTMIRLSLLSAPLYPDPRTDQGEPSFAWSVVADAGVSETLAEANRLNTPVLAEVPAFEPLVRLERTEGVPVLDWIKVADDGSGDIVVRIYEAAGGTATATLAVCGELAGATVREVTVLEEDGLDADLTRALAADGPQAAAGAELTLAPFQLATLRISR